MNTDFPQPLDFAFIGTPGPIDDGPGMGPAEALADDPAYARFRREQAGWLDDWARFAAAREANGYTAPASWRTDQAPREAQAAAAAQREVSQAENAQARSAMRDDGPVLTAMQAAMQQAQADLAAQQQDEPASEGDGA